MKYAGKLNQRRPPPPDRLPISTPDDWREKYAGGEIQHFAECLGLLLDHYKIETGRIARSGASRASTTKRWGALVLG
jgi:hypothetical protein